MLAFALAVLMHLQDKLILKVDAPVSVANSAKPDLRRKIEDRFRLLCAAGHGIFSHEITDIVGPYFPVGETLEAANTTIQQQKIEALRRFKGSIEEGDDAVYFTNFTLIEAVFSNAYVVINLSFVKDHEGKLIIRKSQAFLRSVNM